MLTFEDGEPLNESVKPEDTPWRGTLGLLSGERISLSPRPTRSRPGQRGWIRGMLAKVMVSEPEEPAPRPSVTSPRPEMPL